MPRREDLVSALCVIACLAMATCICGASLARSSQSSADEDAVTKMAEKARAKAVSMKSSELFEGIQQALQRGRAMLSLMQSAKPGAPGNKEAGELVADAFAEQMEFSRQLRERADAKEPDAAFFLALDSFQSCRGLSASTTQGIDVRRCYGRALEQFKVAADLGVPGATFNVAQMYEQGLGTAPSKLAAADWYVRSAEQNWRAKDREQAFAAIEAAQRCEPGNRAATKLLAQIRVNATGR